MTATPVSPAEILRQRESGTAVDFLDVRTSVEFREVHAEIARNVPLDDLDPDEISARKSENPDEITCVICHTGQRAAVAQKKLAAAGVENVVVVEGGTKAWVDEGLPVVRGKKAIALERQVRIAAGSLVFVGAMLTHFVHPGWLALPAFVGAGLVFAGVTDTCGMGMLLSRMPWNRV